MIDNNRIFKDKDMIDIYQYYIDLIKNQEYQEDKNDN